MKKVCIFFAMTILLSGCESSPDCLVSNGDSTCAEVTLSNGVHTLRTYSTVTNLRLEGFEGDVAFVVEGDSIETVDLSGEVTSASLEFFGASPHVLTSSDSLVNLAVHLDNSVERESTIFAQSNVLEQLEISGSSVDFVHSVDSENLSLSSVDVDVADKNSARVRAQLDFDDRHAPYLALLAENFEQVRVSGTSGEGISSSLPSNVEFE